jgi:hypothetical protein
LPQGARTVVFASILRTAAFVALWFAVAGGTVHGADGNKRSFAFSIDDDIEKLTSSLNSRMKTVWFNDPHGGICPQLMSFVYSKISDFRFITPNFIGTFYGNKDKEANSKVFVIGNRACRYTLTMKKFVSQDGVETQLPLRDNEKKLREIFENLERVIRESNAALGEDERQKQPRNGPIEIEGNKLILHIDRMDPDQAGMTFDGVAFESSDVRKEFSGIVYFAPKSFSVYITDVPDFKIGYRKDHAKKSHEVDIMNSTSRLNISLQKEVLGNGWTVVFDD